MVSKKTYTIPDPTEDPADEFDRIAKSILSDILAVNPWIQRFCLGAVGFVYPKSNKAKNLTERYPFFPGVNLMSINPHVHLCTHIRVTGVRCGSPALRDEKYCYFHQRMIRGVPSPKKARIHPMALIESPESIQVALMETINAVVRNQIDLRRAELIIKALHIAVKNARGVHFEWDVSKMIRQLPEPQADEAIATAPPLQAPAPVAAAPSLHSSQAKELPKPAEPPVPRKPPGRVTSLSMARAQSHANARRLKE